MKKKNTAYMRRKGELEVCDKDAIYFLTVILIMIVTFSMFKGEILQLFFSGL
jgi:hypothetical protein